MKTRAVVSLSGRLLHSSRALVGKIVHDGGECKSCKTLSCSSSCALCPPSTMVRTPKRRMGKIERKLCTENKASRRYSAAHVCQSNRPDVANARPTALHVNGDRGLCQQRCRLQRTLSKPLCYEERSLQLTTTEEEGPRKSQVTMEYTFGVRLADRRDRRTTVVRSNADAKKKLL